jgi:Ca2+-binding RTX toxin-like protein
MIIDGDLNDWTSANRIDRGLGDGYAIYAKSDGADFVFALKSPIAISANTTFWLNTDRNASTGYQVFGFAGGAEYNVNIAADGTISLFRGAAGETLVQEKLTTAWSADRSVLEFRVAKADIGNTAAVDILADVNDSVYLPGSYSDGGFTVFNDTGVVADAAQRIAIVYSETTAANYFSATAYSQLFMAAQSQAMQAGVAFDILTEADLTNLSTLAKYDSIVFPSFRNVQADQVTAITQTLEQATKQFGIGLIAAGEFMTNDAGNNALAGDSYARMKLLFDATRVTGGTGDVTLKAADATGLVLDGYGNGEVIHQYSAVGWNGFASVSGTGTTIATASVAGQDYAAAIATQTGGRNVLFSSDAVMADNNMLQKAIDYSVNGSEGISVGLQITRMAGITAARVDMDQSQEVYEVNPEDGSAGIYDKLIPTLAAWKAQYNFVGSYYVNVGADATNGQTTDWAVSLPYYKALLDMGNELGSHSYTHPADTNLLTADQIAYEFGQSRAVLEKQLSDYLGRNVVLDGAAVPGAPEQIATSEEILKYYDYVSGGYSGIGAGYPNAFGYMTAADAAADKVYIAPNTAFDFTLMEFQGKTVAQAEAQWAKEFAEITAHAETPIVVWPWHDYGPAMWSTGTASPYTTQMFTNYIAMAANYGMEFVTLGDLADRISAFEKATVTSTLSGNTITATVTAPQNVGTFALDLDNLATGQVIKSVAGWYAYDKDSVFLPASGGTYAITVGAAADDVTHITALPMRASLLSLNGDGRNLSFSVDGEGKVVVDVQAPGNNWVVVTGGTIVSQVGEIVTIDVGAIGQHVVTVGYTANLAPTITSAGGGTTATFSIAENSTAVTKIMATDANIAQGDKITYSIAAGADDGALFSIDATTGALTFKSGPDFEAPADLNKDNAYLVTVVSTDARGLTDTQQLTVKITDVVGIKKTGTIMADTITGTSEQDTLNGNWGNDIINGLGGNDILIGGWGRDTLTGGAGADIFRFESTLDSGTTAATRDVITDFLSGTDKIDLSAIDSKASLFSWGDQAFTLLPKAGTAITAEGQLRYRYETVSGVEYTVVEGANSGKTIDFAVALTGHHVLTANDFIL